MEMLEAEYSFVADKVARMQAQVSFLIKENYKAIMTLFEGICYQVCIQFFGYYIF